MSRKIRSIPAELRYITAIQLWNEENCKHTLSLPFNYQGGTWFWSRQNDLPCFLHEIDSSHFSIWHVMIAFESLDSSLRTGGFLETCAAMGLKYWWAAGIKHAKDIQGMTKEDEEIILYQSLLSAASFGHVEMVNFILSRLHYPAHDYASKVLTTTSKTPLHFLPMLRGSDEDIENIASQLASVGFDVNKAISSRDWLPPLGIELYGTPLHVATRLRSLPAVKALIRLGADPLVTSRTSRSPLEEAICLHLPEVVYIMSESQHSCGEKLRDSFKAIGTVSSKGIFDKWLLHPPADSYQSAMAKGFTETVRVIRGMCCEEQFQCPFVS